MEENKQMEIEETVKEAPAAVPAEASVPQETAEAAPADVPAEGDAPAEESTAAEGEAAAPAEEAAVAEDETPGAAEAPQAAEPDNAPAETPEAEEAAEEPAAAAEQDEAEEPKPARPLPTTKEEVIARLKEIVIAGESVDRTEVEALKQTYYRLTAAAAAEAREAFIAAGGAAEDFVPAPDPEEENFKAQMGRIREIRAAAAEAQEKEKQAGLEKKLEIIEKIKAMAASPADADKNYDAFKTLQNEWKEVKAVPAEKSTELWKNYQLYVEQFYDQLRLNHEFRAYDFKKNLEIKTRLCEAAEKLAEVEDPVSAFHQLQKLHQEFRETGPVAKDLREEIWKRFKEASTLVNKRHQEHFEGLKAREEENLVKKTALCEKVEAIATDGLKTFAEWDAQTNVVLEIQKEWKTIGFTPKKMNAKIFERFRAACDAFFTAKTTFFKSTRETFAANLAKKNALCEQAEALKDSTEWASTTNKLVALQKEWKTIGPVAHKVSEVVWKRFNDACNFFFEQKNAATAGQRQEEEANLTKKNEIIEALEQLLAAPGEDVQQQVRDLQAQWNETGHVPFRKKEKMYKRYHDICDRIYKELHISAGRRNLDNFKKNVAEKGGNELTRERNRLMTAYDAKKQEIKNYETNLTFLNAKSKGANSLVEEINRKVERLKEDLDLLAEKINAVNEKIKTEE